MLKHKNNGSLKLLVEDSMAIDKYYLGQLMAIATDADPRLFPELVDDFERVCPLFIEDIQIGFELQDAAVIVQSLNKLKSSSGFLGLIQLSQLSFAIMRRYKSGELENPSAEVSKLRGVYDIQISELNAYIKR